MCWRNPAAPIIYYQSVSLEGEKGWWAPKGKILRSAQRMRVQTQTISPEDTLAFTAIRSIPIFVSSLTRQAYCPFSIEL